ncbi:DUF3592 domain-containing protein [Mangrovibacter phragmitis]|uniref:DUF3592 domain-containing protein n=1 Tax=Mangrovibacter phragmitis TaxID=1691903 RepID=UPI00336AD583
MKKIFGLMFSVSLVLFFIAGYLAYSNHQFQRDAIHAKGQITHLRYSYNADSSSEVWFPEITFTDNTGKRIVFESTTGRSSYRDRMGDTIDVIYNQNDVTSAKINDTVGLYLGAFICGGIALVFLLIGGAGLWLMNSGKRHQRLIHNGKPLAATIVSVELNEAIQINGRSPWRIVCQWLDPQSGRVFLFNSANFYYDPSPYIKEENITVYVAHNNVNKYYVDISGFPEKA